MGAMYYGSAYGGMSLTRIYTHNLGVYADGFRGLKVFPGFEGISGV